MIAIILAGGKGERLRPLTHYVPKVLLPLGTKPLLDYIVGRLCSLGVSEIFVAVSDFHDLVERYLKATGSSVRVVRVLGWETGGDLGIALEAAGVTGDVLVWNGDTVTDMDLSTLYRDHKTLGTLATIGGVRVPASEALGKKGVIRVRGGIVTELVEKPSRPLSEDSVVVNGGVYVLDARFTEVNTRRKLLLPRKCKLEVDVFPQLALAGKLGVSLPPCTYNVDVGLPEDYVKAFAMFSQDKK